MHDHTVLASVCETKGQTWQEVLWGWLVHGAEKASTGWCCTWRRQHLKGKEASGTDMGRFQLFFLSLILFFS